MAIRTTLVTFLTVISQLSYVAQGAHLGSPLDNAELEITNLALSSLANLTTRVQTLESSLQINTRKIEDLTSQVQFLDPLTSSIEGLLVGTYEGVSNISLPSLQKKIFSVNFSRSVAFDWNSRKVYWQVKYPEKIMRANVDGTELENVLEDICVDYFAVDWISGNIYYYDCKWHDIRLCSSRSGKCAILLTNQTAPLGFLGSRIGVFIALHPPRSLMFWVNGTGTYRANMDGTDARKIISERPWSISVDEEAHRIYWVGDGIYFGRKYIASSDLDGKNQRVLINDTYLRGLAVNGNKVYFGYDSVYSVSKYGGDPITITYEISGVTSIALYGTRRSLIFNPCESSPCSCLCVPILKSFRCICPQGAKLQEDGTTCLYPDLT